MTNLESQLRRLRFRPPSAAARDYALSPGPAPAASARKINPWLASSLAYIWVMIALFYYHTPEVVKPDGPRITYREFQEITIIKNLQIAALESEGRLLNFDGPDFSAPLRRRNL
ncbi:MAG: hypothetical protein LBK60_02730 [Verrucomicrobiales bacterium]|jgi:hypothetical protein|nr:hypothetical protein [Verrucomicrobiales bacterium]